MARVLEDGVRTIVIPVYLLPPGAKAGDVFGVSRSDERGGSVHIAVTANDGAALQAQARARRALERALAASKRNDPGGDVAL